MKKICVVAMMLLLVSLTSAEPYKDKDKTPSTGRVLIGKVLDRQDNPVPNAVVYLTNMRTRAVKTYIVGEEGDYRFPALSSGVD